MKRLILIICTLAIAVASYAQRNGKVQNQYAKIYKTYAKDPTDVANLVAMATFYADSTNAMHNLSLGYKYIRQAEDLYVAMVEDNASYRKVRRLISKRITIASVRESRQQIYNAIKRHLQSDAPVSDIEMNLYIELLSNDISIMKMIDRRRMHTTFEQLKNSQSIDDIYAFQQKYPNTAEAEHLDTLIGQIAAPLIASLRQQASIDSIVGRYPKSSSIARLAVKQRGSIAFDMASKENSIEAYQTFLAQHPSSNEYVEALDRIETLIEAQYATLHTASDYADFISNNSENPLADDAMEQLHMLILERHDMGAARLYLDRFLLDPLYNDIFRQFYDWHAAEGNRQPIETFAQEYPNFPFKQALDVDLADGLKVDAINLMDNFTESEFETYASHIYHLTGKKASFVALQRTLQQQIAQRRWPAAIERMQFFELSFENDCTNEYAELHRLLSAPYNESRVATAELTAGYNIVNPTPHPNGRQFYYTKKSGNRSSICTATANKEHRWKNDGELHFANDDNANLTFFSFFDNGRKMLLGKEGDIYVAYCNDTVWHIAEQLPAPVNTPYTETDARMTPDGSGMLLASDRANGHNLQRSGAYFHGDTALASDLYYIPTDNNGWGDPINLGIPVNSLYSERQPLLSQNLKTLYFISDATGMGYGDIYMTTRTNVSDWQHWSQPVNLGKEVNSGFNEASIALSADERRMYIASNRDNNSYACYVFNTWHNTTANIVTITVDLSSLPSTVKRLYLVETSQQRIVEVIDTPQNQQLPLPLYGDHHYALVAEVEGYVVASTALPTKGVKTVSLEATTVYQLDDLGTTVALPLVTFEPNTAQLNPLATVELEMIAAILAYHPTARIEIHTQMDGTDDSACYNLSLERGEAVRRYLVDRNIDASRIAIYAFGNVNYKSGAKPANTSVRFHTR